MTSFLASAFICLCLLVEGCASRPQSVPPRPGPDFPSSDSYYPARARLFGRQGTTVIHFCVDAKGHLANPPTVQKTSGSEDLDEAALRLANDGDGHYKPAYQGGLPQGGCDSFTVKFQFRTDPRFPELARRENIVTGEFGEKVEQIQARFKSISRPPGLESFEPGNGEQLNQLKKFVEDANDAVKRVAELTSTHISQVDELGRSEDVSEAERTAFRKEWQIRRAAIRQARESVLDLQSALASVVELINYVQTTEPPLSGPQGPVQPTARQRADIDLLIGRAKDSYAKTSRLLKKPRATAGHRQELAVISGPDGKCLRGIDTVA